MVALDLDGQMARDSAVAAIDSLARGHDGREGAEARFYCHANATVKSDTAMSD